ncbi:hypothetical protein RRG08_062691 [Elysia crispata]|uniref:Elongation factor 1-alpha n=1 Tax=Elysia crispata TaxID=231223 RepID=A0AAE1ADA3_9GAST|nr:hypothetical protein RRG08_062691 [Elysia crispata]
MKERSQAKRGLKQLYLFAMEKKKIQVVFTGAHNSDKSTIVGYLAAKLGRQDGRSLSRLEREDKAEWNDSSFRMAYFVDKTNEERERSVPKETYQTSLGDLIIADVPGSRRFIKDTLDGCLEADCVVLTVSAAVGEFELGMTSGGETREQALLAYSLGVEQLIVAVNQMDSTNPPYSEARFNEIKEEISAYIEKIGYNPRTVAFVPICGLQGENMTTSSDKMAWFEGWTIERRESKASGKTLLEALEAVLPPTPRIEQPLRLPLREVQQISGVRTVAVGRVETGVLKTGMLLTIGPQNLTTMANFVVMDNKPVTEALPGDVVSFSVGDSSVEEISIGNVAGDYNNDPPKKALSFTARMMVMEHPGTIEIGSAFVIKCHTDAVTCKVEEILEKIACVSDVKDEEDEANPKVLKSGEAAMVKLTPSKPTVVEPFQHYARLGRFIVEQKGRVAAVGVIKTVEKDEASQGKITSAAEKRLQELKNE